MRISEPLLGRFMATDASYDFLNRTNALRWFNVAMECVEDGKHDRMREAVRKLQFIVLKRGRNSEEALYHLLMMTTFEKNGSEAAGMLREESEAALIRSLELLTFINGRKNTSKLLVNASVHGFSLNEAKLEALIDGLSELFMCTEAAHADEEKLGNLSLIEATRDKLMSLCAKLPKSKFPELRQKALETIETADSKIAGLATELANASG
ncbi:Uncharacterised protein [Candidatus Burarchaeum australiense]|nr:Uncharacterised protein [Candidatus Burarchaeum australiense]